MEYRKFERILVMVSVGLALLVIWMLCGQVGSCNVAYAEEAPDPPSEMTLPLSIGEDLVERTDRAIEWLARVAPNHPVNARPEWRRELAQYIVEESFRQDLPWALVTAIAYRESSFRPASVGGIGELGVMQVAPSVQRWCRQQDIKIGKARGQIQCGTKWLRYVTDELSGGDLELGFARYCAFGASRPFSRKVRAIVNDRFSLADKLERVTARDDDQAG